VREFSHLFFLGLKSLKGYTGCSGKYVRVKKAKQAWLKPLLRHKHDKDRHRVESYVYIRVLPVLYKASLIQRKAKEVDIIQSRVMMY
jgi:hypothetical protein